MPTLSTLEPAKKAWSLLDEFKNFALKGNVVDLAVGVIIGGAFAGIVNSLVKNLIMPAVSVILPAEQSYTQWAVTAGGKVIPYGLFIGDVVNFLILALVLYLFVVKFLGWLMRMKKDAPPPPPTREQELLAEIRDLLKAESGTARGAASARGAATG